ncbi:immunoreactive antigen [Nonlabens sp. MIC269]|uniref:type IX secretion system anionic LPS delivery protein PorZ n=1 Tax=Nonlabens sp. MIC269 TaxID=1476901 RepID=UPI0007222994|nr:T9SS type A sorting domain-containing protein [Nonlabens sp. MIC269]ALM20806.1 immunoreactive antigen [Nonlabens sp. MIC269]
MKYFFFSLLIVLSFRLQAQNFENSWEGFFSFNEIIDLERTDEVIYAAASNSIFTYNIASGEISTITTINGLSGERISQIFYSEDKDVLVIAFENGLLQIVESTGDITTEVAIRDKAIISQENKRVNEFLERGDLLYIATNFGIAIYNLEDLEFDDTYFIGDNGSQIQVNSIAISNNTLFAATQDGGFRIADITNPFLIDFANWTQTNSDVWVEVFPFDSEIYAVTEGRFIFRYNGSSLVSTGIRVPQPVKDVDTTDSTILFVGNNRSFLYDTNLNIVSTVDLVNGESFNYNAGVIDTSQFYLGTQNSGMLIFDQSNIISAQQVLADGPSRNSAFSISAVPNELWVAYGDYDIFYNPFPLESFGVSHLVNESWINHEFDDVLNARSIASITINPSNTNQVYLNSMIDGLIEFTDDVAVQQFTESNTSMTQIGGNPNNGTRIPSSVFDNSGDLWVLNSITNTTINRKSPTDNWTAVDFSVPYPGELELTSATKIDVSSTGNLFFGTTGAGLYAYNPTDGTFGNLNENIQEGNLVNNYVSAVRLDQNNALWIGSNLGLRVLFNANSIFEDQVTDARPIVIEDSNNIPRELLDGVTILDIEIDGNNRKWIATAGSGAFLFSPSGRETIFQFTKENSPLPSDVINDIAIDGATGKVYFATNNGIVAFQGDRSSEPRENLENVFVFPNPVRPGFNGNVTIDGLTDRARVKITDVEGNLVYEEVSQGGSITWDQRNFGGVKVASGVYLLLISTDDNIETTVTKLMIIR